MDDTIDRLFSTTIIGDTSIFTDNLDNYVE